jgi:hypothetical protein
MRDNERLLEQLRERLTVPVPVAGKALCDLGRNASYEAAKSGSIGGVPVIKIGTKLAVPTAPIRRRLGLEAA